MGDTIIRHALNLPLKVDWAESEAWKGEGMSLPSECYSGCVYQKEGDDSGHHYSNLYLTYLLIPSNPTYSTTVLDPDKIVLF